MGNGPRLNSLNVGTDTNLDPGIYISPFFLFPKKFFMDLDFLGIFRQLISMSVRFGVDPNKNTNLVDVVS